MDKHVIEWLGAYHDGELQPALADQVRDHLAACNDCRQELADLENLTGLLQANSVPVPDPLRSASQLKIRLPARQANAESRPGRQTIWWIIPILVLIIALVLQIATNMTTILLVAEKVGLLGGLNGLLPGTEQAAGASGSWFSLFSLMLEGNLGILLVLSESARQSVELILTSITWQFALALVYIAWLTAVWNNRSRLLSIRIKNHSGSIGV
jgi:hypothetical protein